MKTALKAAAVIFLVLLIVAVGAVLALPSILSTDLVKNKVADLVEQKTGRTLTIAGDTSFKLFPNIAVALNDLSLSNPPGMSGAPLVKMGALRANLKLMPLFRGQTEVESVTLVKPQFNLLVDKSGRQNWDFNTAQSEPGAASRPGDENAKGQLRYTLGKVTIEDGFVHYRNMKDVIDQTIANIKLDLTQSATDQSLTAEGSLEWEKERFGISSHVDQPAKLVAGKPSNMKLEIRSSLTNSTLTGVLGASPQPSFEGKLITDTPSIRKLAAFLGHDLPQNKGFGPLKIDTQLKANAKTVSFQTKQAQFDNMSLAGKGVVTLQNPRPKLVADLDVGKLDLNKYLPQGGDAASGGGSPASDNTNAVIDLSALKMIDAKVNLKAVQIIYKKATMSEADLGVDLENGLMQADIRKLALYRGTATGAIVLNARGSTNEMSSKLDLADVLTGAVLRDFAGFEKLAGKGAVNADLKSKGNSLNALIGDLDGNARIKLEDGRIEGFDLAKYVGQFSGNEVPSSVGANGKPMTAFSEMFGTFDFKNGMAHNKNFRVLGSYFKVRASGRADLQRKTLNFRVAPKLFSGDWSFAPPLKVTGPWSKPKASFDTYAFLGGSGGVVRSLSGLINGKKLNLGDVLKNRGLQTDAEIETYLEGKKVDASDAAQPTGEAQTEEGKPSPLEGLLKNDKSGLGGLLGGGEKKDGGLLNKLLQQ